MIGKKLAHYEILEKLGQGGMGEVWKARDTNLDREVAIKILPEMLGADAQRLSRFEREAKLLALLNHSGIAAVYGLHEQEGQRFLAMELVPGEDLSKRLEKGPLEVGQALFVGVQVAEALEAAHAQGVIHRDLKPANIILTPDGRAKVLDFGLAKVSEASPSGSASLSPTLSGGATAAGVILGTAAYMSPEQARGKELDRRTDIWSFGCVLYECLAGGSLYKGETISDSLGAILHKEPDWSLLPANTPPTVRLLLRRCLTKDADKRLHDIADARIELEQAIEDPDGSSVGLAISALEAGDVRRRRSGASWTSAVGAGLALAAGLAVGWMAHGPSQEAKLRKLDLGVRATRGGDEPREPVLSPDESHLVFIQSGQLWVQALDALEPRLLEGTEGALVPFWSPDSKEIGYIAGRKLWRIPALGGSSVAIGDLGGPISGGRGASWGEDGRIVFTRGNSGLLSIPSLGGEPKDFLVLAEGDADFHEPHVLPEGRGILFVVHPVDQSPKVLALLHDSERKVLLDATAGSIHFPVYAPSGHILFSRTGGDATQGLWAMPFSLADLAVEGEPFLVAADALAGSVSRYGTLAFQRLSPAAGENRFTWADRMGNALEAIGGDRVDGNQPTLSPDGRRLAFIALDRENETSALWVRDLQRETETRLTLDEAFEIFPLWTPSGEEIVFTSFDRTARKLLSYIVPADGSGAARPIGEGFVITGLTPDGQSFVATVAPEGASLGLSGDADLALMSLGSSDEPRILVGGPDRESDGRVSPDGRWLAFRMERGESRQIYLTRFPEATGRWQVSVDRGENPYWDPRGDRLYFRDGWTLMEVTVGVGDEPILGKVTPVTELPELADWRGFDVARNGERLILVERAGSDQVEDRSGIKIVQSWIREFER